MGIELVGLAYGKGFVAVIISFAQHLLAGIVEPAPVGGIGVDAISLFAVFVEGNFKRIHVFGHVFVSLSNFFGVTASVAFLYPFFK